MRFIFSSVISILPFVLMLASCGDNDHETQTRFEAPVASFSNDPTTPLEKREWKRIYFDWTSEEGKDACQVGRITLTRAGMIESAACGEIREVQITPEDLAEIDAQLTLVMNEWTRPLSCLQQQNDDYSIDMKVVDAQNRARRIFRFDDESVCFRGKSHESFSALEKNLDNLRRKYLSELP